MSAIASNTRSGLDRWLRSFAPYLPAVVCGGVLIIWVQASGGYFTDAWYPSAIGAVGLLGITTIGTRRILPSRREARIALLGFGLLVGFNYLSMIWADSPGSALQASNKLLLYLVAAWTIALLPWTPRTIAALLGVWSLVIAVLCAIALIGALTASDLTRYFVELRFAEPMRYSNATAALAAMAVWPALLLASHRGLPVLLQSVSLGVAVFLADFSLLPQSRAAPLGLVLVAPLVLAVASNRLRVAARMAVLGASLAFSLPRTLDVDRAVSGHRVVTPVLRHAASGMLLATVAAAAVALGFALIERRLLPAFIGRLRSRRAAAGVARAGGFGRRRLVGGGALLAALGVVLAIAAGSIGHAASAEWHRLRGDSGNGPRLLSSAPEERLDYLRVGLRLVRASPVGGVGSGNFGRHYDALRHYQKHSQYTHNLAVRVLAETGVVGLVLLVTVVIALVLGAFRAGREHGDLGRICAAAALGVAAYFLVHDSLDWMDEFPALAIPALAFPLAVAALAPRGRRGPPTTNRPASAVGTRRLVPRPRSLPPRLRTAWRPLAFVVAGLLAAVALVPPYFASRYVERAFATYRSQPDAAFRDLNRASGLNPFSIEPLVAKGTIAINLGEAQAARLAFADALRREQNWYPWLQLALLDAQAGQFATASASLARAARLDVNDQLIQEARREITHHQLIDPARFNRLILSGPGGLFERDRIR